MIERQHYRVSVRKPNGRITTESIMARDAETARAAFENSGDHVYSVEIAETKQYAVSFRSADGDLQYAEIIALDEDDVKNQFDRLVSINKI